MTFTGTLPFTSTVKPRRIQLSARKWKQLLVRVEKLIFPRREENIQSAI